MKRAYILVYSSDTADRDTIKRWADESPLVPTWRIDLPYSIYLITEASVLELYKDLDHTLGGCGRYIITEISDNRQGRLPLDTWQFLRNKQTQAIP